MHLRQKNEIHRSPPSTMTFYDLLQHFSVAADEKLKIYEGYGLPLHPPTFQIAGSNDSHLTHEELRDILSHAARKSLFNEKHIQKKDEKADSELPVSLIELPEPTPRVKKGVAIIGFGKSLHAASSYYEQMGWSVTEITFPSIDEISKIMLANQTTAFADKDVRNCTTWAIGEFAGGF